MKIDRVVVRCKRCKKERTYEPDPPIANAIALEVYMHRDVGACPSCAFDTADVMVRDTDPTPAERFS
jgi:hypothetical protein